MQRILVLLITCFSVCLTTYASAQAATGGWQDLSASVAGQTLPLRVYTPSNYPASAPYPVVYLLPGLGEPVTMWETSALAQLADQHQLILVSVPGTLNDTPSWYSRQSNIPQPSGGEWQVAFDVWFLNGVIPTVERSVAARADRGGRALLGFSMGGKGALTLAAQHPDMFVATVSVGGVTDLSAFAASYPESRLRDVYGDPAEQSLRYAAESPLELARNLRGLSVTILHSTDDQIVPVRHGELMHERLAAAGVDHIWQELPLGGHSVTPEALQIAFERFNQALHNPQAIPVEWGYRCADITQVVVYDTTIRKTDPQMWTDLVSVSGAAIEVTSGDPIEILSAARYTPGTSYTVDLTPLDGRQASMSVVVADSAGRLTLTIPAGHIRADIAELAVVQPAATASLPTSIPTSLPNPKLTPAMPEPGATKLPTEATTVADATLQPSALPSAEPEQRRPTPGTGATDPPASPSGIQGELIILVALIGFAVVIPVLRRIRRS
jgi:S-formylglutathione hydrolase FrmB